MTLPACLTRVRQHSRSAQAHIFSERLVAWLCPSGVCYFASLACNNRRMAASCFEVMCDLIGRAASVVHSAQVRAWEVRGPSAPCQSSSAFPIELLRLISFPLAVIIPPLFSQRALLVSLAVKSCAPLRMFEADVRVERISCCACRRRTRVASLSLSSS